MDSQVIAKITLLALVHTLKLHFKKSARGGT